MPGNTHISPILSDELVSSNGFTVDPDKSFVALTVPRDKAFVLTDVFVFPLVEKSNPEFLVRYRIEENAGTRFQYNTVGTSANWSQHFTSGILFAPGSKVKVVSTELSSGRTGFQLLGYFTKP
jgi:hypothetical protein